MGFFYEDERLKRLSQMGDPLEKISKAVDWEMFRPILNKAFRKKARGKGGRPPWDCVLMFKILLLQAWYNIADDKTEYMINDRLSFQRFLGLCLGDKVPDAKTVWLFRENLAKSGAERELFDLFASQMENCGVAARQGSLVDEKDKEIRADSAYCGEGLHAEIHEKNPLVKLKTNEKGYRNRPLTEAQKDGNREKSKVCARVEHVFGHMTNSMGGMYMRCIGKTRAQCTIGLKNLAYNLSRYAYLASVKKPEVQL
ncbi:MAG: transposase [Clostridiales bacterium]|nr:transposase [Clostridiales bacterium]